MIAYPKATLTSEPFIPCFKQIRGDNLNYPKFGHTACYAHGKLFRARLPLDRNYKTVEYSITEGLEPNWKTFLAYDNQYASSARWVEGGFSSMMACAPLPNGFRLFYSVHNNYTSSQRIVYYDFGINDGNIGVGQIPYYSTSETVAFACTSATEVFALHQTVFSSKADILLTQWHDDIWGSLLVRYEQIDGAWSDAEGAYSVFTHSDGGMVRDNPTDQQSLRIKAQWGYVMAGGLAVNDLGDKVVVSGGMTHWNKWGYDTHRQGLTSFIYHRDCKLWEQSDMQGIADYDLENRLSYDCYATGNTLSNGQFVVWNRNAEPASFEQEIGSINIPRKHFTYYAKLHPSGRYLTQPQYLGDSLDLTCAKLIEMSGRIYAIGYEAIYEAPQASFLSNVETPQSLELFTNSFKVQQNNRFGLGVQAQIEDARAVINNQCGIGQVARAYIDGVQIGYGFIDSLEPVIRSSVNPSGWSHKSSLVSRADKPLRDTRAESADETLPQTTKFWYPDPPVAGIFKNRGSWKWTRMKWPSLFFDGQYPALDNHPSYQCQSSPAANISNKGMTTGYGGKIWDTKPEKMGSWYMDTVWLAQPPSTNGAIYAKIRFGDNEGQESFEGKTQSGKSVSATINRQHGIIESIDWSGIGNKTQRACMGGLIVGAIEDRKKYAFIWEADNDFVTSTHCFTSRETMDRAVRNGVGQNRLALLISDYNKENETWAKDEEWVNLEIYNEPCDLVPGRPAELCIKLMNSRIFCYYRPVAKAGESLYRWRFAFSYNAGRFGAGRLGLIARGQSTIQWDDLWPLRREINRTDNVVDFWDIRTSDGVMDRTIADCLEKYSWYGLTLASFVNFIDMPLVSQGVIWSSTMHPVIDFKMSFSDRGECGLILRATHPTGISYMVIAIEFTGNDNIPYLIKRKVIESELVDLDNIPIHLSFSQGQKIPVRVSALNDIYSVWIAGHYMGHFYDSTELGLYTGVWNPTFCGQLYDVKMPELHEVVSSVLVDVGQSMDTVIKGIIDKRMIKGVYKRDGSLLMSYFNHAIDIMGNFEDGLIQNGYRKSDRFISVQNVHGACHFATYENPTLLCQGRRFASVTIDNIMNEEFCYLAAKEIVKEAWEQQDMPTFVGLYNLSISPEDIIRITVNQQDIIARKFIIDDIQFGFQMSQFNAPQFMMTVSCRQWIDQALMV